MAAPIGAISLRLPSTNFILKHKALKGARKVVSLNSSESHLKGEAVQEKDCDHAITCLPVIVEFRRLLQSAKYNAVDVVPGVSNRELLHTVVGLYDTCLPDITPLVLYATVSGKGAKTLILVRNTKDVAEELLQRILNKEKEIRSQETERKAKELKNGELPTHPPEFPSEPENKEETSDASQLASSKTQDKTQNKTQGKASCVNSEESPLLTLLDGSNGNAVSGRRDDDGCHGDMRIAAAGEDKEDVLEEEDARKVFADVFSDSDIEEEESDEEEEEDFSRGINEFLKLVKERRERRDELGSNPSVEELETTVGIESRIVACATWEKSHIRPGEKIVQIDLVGVRKRCRRRGIGRYLLRQMKDVSVVGPYDSLVVYADHSAVDFFALHGFSDDIVLNSKYSDLADNWTNCTLMCFIPPFVGQTILRDTDMTLDLKAMELELQKWTERSREAYQGQVACIMKLRHEVIALRALVSSQKDLIQSLSGELETMHADKLMLEKSNLQHKIAAIKAGYSGRHYNSQAAPENGSADSNPANPVLDSDDDDDDVKDDEDEGDKEIDDDDDDDDDDEEIDTEELIKALEAEAYGFQGSGANFCAERGDSESLEIAAKFEAGMVDQPHPGQRSNVTKVTMANLPSSIKELYQIRLKQLGDPTLYTRLYFCGSLHRPERINKILSQGFSDEDYTYGDYGVGLYFSEYPGTAAQFSALGKMLVAEVGLGRTESVIKKDRTRVTAPIGSDSILTQGRLYSSSLAVPGAGASGVGMMSTYKEYVVYDPLQVLPVSLIEYTSRQSCASVRL